MNAQDPEARYYAFRRTSGVHCVVYARGRADAAERVARRAPPDPAHELVLETDDFEQVRPLLADPEGRSLDASDYHGAHIVEAVCSLCGDVCNLNPHEDEGPWLEHLGDEYGDECGGIATAPLGYYLAPEASGR